MKCYFLINIDLIELYVYILYNIHFYMKSTNFQFQSLFVEVIYP